jgi:hypothetical protein
MKIQYAMAAALLSGGAVRAGPSASLSGIYPHLAMSHT